MNILPVFSLTHIQNTGIAFGLFQGRNLIFIALGLVMSVFILWFAWKEFRDSALSGYALALILGGAWGNLTDRIARGYVTDFLDFYIGSHHWPAFNVADSAICVGAVILVLLSMKKQKTV